MPHKLLICMYTSCLVADQQDHSIHLTHKGGEAFQCHCVCNKKCMKATCKHVFTYKMYIYIYTYIHTRFNQLPSSSFPSHLSFFLHKTLGNLSITGLPYLLPTFQVNGSSKRPKRMALQRRRLGENP